MRERYWTDWAPWLARLDAGDAPVLDALGGPDAWWWLEKIGTTLGRIASEDVVSAFSEYLADYRSRIPLLPLGRLLPFLPSGMPIEALPSETLGTAVRALRRRQLHHVADIAELSVAQLYDFPGWGIGTMRRTLAALVEVGLSRDADPDFKRLENTGAERSLLEDIATVAAWLDLRDRESEPILGADIEDFAPLRVNLAGARLRGLSASAMASEFHRGRPIEQIAAVIDAMSDTDLKVLTHRIVGDERSSEARMARRLRVKQERLSETERRVRGQIGAVLAAPSSAMLIEAFRKMAPEVAPLERIVENLPVLGREVPGVGIPLWRFLSRFEQAVFEKDGWIGSMPIEQAVRICSFNVGDLARASEPVRMEIIGALLPAGVNDAEMSAWLSYCGIDIEILDEEEVLVAAQSMADRAARMLARAGVPMRIDQIAVSLGWNERLESVEAALASDERIARIDVRTYALASWNMETYPDAVQGFVRRALEAAGGEISLEELVATLTGRYGLAASSVRSVASKMPFRVEHGIVKWFLARRV